MKNFPQIQVKTKKKRSSPSGAIFAFKWEWRPEKKQKKLYRSWMEQSAENGKIISNTFRSNVQNAYF